MKITNKTARNLLIILGIIVISYIKLLALAYVEMSKQSEQYEQSQQDELGEVNEQQRISNDTADRLDFFVEQLGLKPYNADSFFDPEKNFLLDVNFKERFLVLMSEKEPPVLVLTIPGDEKYITVSYSEPIEGALYWDTEEDIEFLNEATSDSDPRFVKFGDKLAIAMNDEDAISYLVCSPKVTVGVKVFSKEKQKSMFDSDVNVILHSLSFKM